MGFFTFKWIVVSNLNNVSVMLYGNSLLPLYNVAVMNFHTTLFSLLPLWYEIIVSEILHFSNHNFAFLTWFAFLFSQECQSCDSEVPVPSHSCQKSLSKSLVFDSWLGKTWLICDFRKFRVQIFSFPKFLLQKNFKTFINLFSNHFIVFFW